MKVSLKKAFSILDGRLSTEIGDVYEMLNYIFDANFFTHQIPTAMRKVQELNPMWYSAGVAHLEEIRSICGTNDFKTLIDCIDKDYSNPDYDIELGKLDVNIDFMAGLESFS